jgi:hypothetical protein
LLDQPRDLASSVVEVTGDDCLFGAGHHTCRLRRGGHRSGTWPPFGVAGPGRRRRRGTPACAPCSRCKREGSKSTIRSLRRYIAATGQMATHGGRSQCCGALHGNGGACWKLPLVDASDPCPENAERYLVLSLARH